MQLTQDRELSWDLQDLRVLLGRLAKTAQMELEAQLAEMDETELTALRGRLVWTVCRVQRALLAQRAQSDQTVHPDRMVRVAAPKL